MINIMLIEDDPIISIDILNHLKEENYSAFRPANIKAIFKHLKTENFDLILLDYDLRMFGTNENGFSVLKEIFKIKYLPIIMVTAIGESNIFKELDKEDITGIMLKPLNYRELSLNIEIALHNFKFKKELKELQGIIHICGVCKKIEDNKRWYKLEDYLSTRSDLRFSSGVCPECSEKLYGTT